MSDKNVIYGAGVYGRKLLKFISLLGVKVDYFCQTQVEEGTYLDGIPVISFAKLCGMNERFRIFVAIRNEKVSEKIRRWLWAAFMEKAYVVEFGDFLRKNSFVNDCVEDRYCYLCQSCFEEFSSGGGVDVENVELFKEHHVIGGGYREDYACPVCGSIDRERWQFLVLANATGIFRNRCCVLHFAPEPRLSEYIAANPRCDYYTGDISLGRAMHKTDILDIQYKDSIFDYVIMNHVLEHISDMARAMYEVKRVLKHTGKMILSFPICTDIDTIEGTTSMTDKERLEKFGQRDHVRLFGRDYVQRIKSFGFDVSVHTPSRYFSQDDIKRYGLIKDDVIMICSKI